MGPRSSRSTEKEGIKRITSGWLAFEMGESLIAKLHNDASLLERGDGAYIIAPLLSTGLWVSKPDGTIQDVLEWSNCRVEVHEICEAT